MRLILLPFNGRKLSPYHIPFRGKDWIRFKLCGKCAFGSTILPTPFGYPILPPPLSYNFKRTSLAFRVLPLEIVLILLPVGKIDHRNWCPGLPFGLSFFQFLDPCINNWQLGVISNSWGWFFPVKRTQIMAFDWVTLANFNSGSKIRSLWVIKTEPGSQN